MTDSDRAVAIIGVGLRLPGGLTSLDELWDALVRGRDLVGEMPEDRFARARYVDPGPVRVARSYTAAGGFLPDVAGFDAGFFGIAPTEAVRMDPQQRLVLEMAVEALDDAGLPAESLAGSSASVFIGVSDPAYIRLQAQVRDEASPYVMSGGALSIVANRLSYCLDLHGPSMAVETACSSALVAVDRACRTLLDGTSRVAFAGGVNVLVGPDGFSGFSAASMLSRHGRCAAFSAAADGFVRAEGGGVVVLKRLADALADGDRIHAVIAGSGSNCDGRTAGLALPSAQGQEALLRDVYERTGIAPDDLVYFEAHGTGTPVGDPAEAQAVGRALGRRRSGGPLPIGSVKSNLGHLEPASGMPGLFKALLVLRHGMAPATLHALPLNPGIDFTGLRLAPTVEPVELDVRPGAAVGVNSFGFGGANAHAVLTLPPAELPAGPSPAGPLPVVISARSPKALQELGARMSDRLRRAAPEEFYDLAHTSTRRRSAHPHRAAVLADEPGAAAEELERVLAGEAAAGAVVTKARHDAVVYAFSGNASQWPGMGADLYAADPVFRAAVEEADAALAPRLGWSVAGELARPEAPRWQRTEVVQPALFALQLGLTAQLAAHGIRPAAVLGHSVGEVAAAHAAGALTLEQAALVVAERSRAQAATAGTGRMVAVGLSERDARDVLARYDGALELAGVNSDRDVTIAGPARALAALGAELTARDVFFRELDLDYAFHTRAMDPIAPALLSALAGLTPSAARIPFVSTVTAAPLAGQELTAAYWWRNIREPVRFAEAVAHALAPEPGTVVEIGPHPVLGPYLRRTGATYVPTLRRDADGPAAARAAVAGVLASGAAVDWAVHFPRPGRVADLPAYPWQRKRLWLGGPGDWERSSGTGRVEHPLLGERLPAPHPTWEGAIEPQLVPWLADHRVEGAVVMPAAGYLDMALAAGRRALEAAVEVRHFEIARPLTVSWPDPGGARLQTTVVKDGGTLAISTAEGRGKECHILVRAQVRPVLGHPPAPVAVEEVRARCPHVIDGARHYRETAAAGIDYGPAFRVLRELRVGDGEVLASYACDASGAADHEVWPAVLDAAFQAGAPLLHGRATGGDLYLPRALEALRVWRAPAPTGLIRVRRRVTSEAEAGWDVTVMDEDGTVTLEADRLWLRRMPSGRVPLTVQRTVLRAAPWPGHDDRETVGPGPAGLVTAASGRIAALRTAWRDSGHTADMASGLTSVAACWAGVLAGFLTDATEPFTVGDLVTAGLLPQHRRLVKAMLPRLQEHGVVRLRPDGRWQLAPLPARAEETLRSILADHPGIGAETVLTTRHLQHLPRLLRGVSDPLQLLASDPVRLQQLYDLSPHNRFSHLLLRSVLEEIVRLWPQDRPLRILEVGAGTGGLTAAVLPVLPADRTRYTFTDISPAFLSAAEHRFQAYDCIDYRTFDLDADSDGQGVPDGAFDVVLAANALHTAADLAAAVRRVGRLLAPGGRLLAAESHDLLQLASIFGTLDSFWSRRDRDLRPECVLLDAARWPGLLERCGLTGAVRIGLEAGAEPADISVLVAAAADRPAATPALAPAPAGAVWTVAAETPAEEPLARALAELLGDNAEVTTFDRLTAEPPFGTEELVTVVLLGEPEEDPETLVVRSTRRAAALRELADRRDRLPEGMRTRTWLVTRPSGLLPAPERPAHPGDAPTRAASRTLANEKPGLNIRRISLDRAEDAATDARRLARELLEPSDEDEIVLTRGGRFVPRETGHPAHEPSRTGPADSFALAVRDPGLSYRLAWTERPLPRPGPGEVVVGVRAVGLNYRDTLQANGLLPAEAAEGTLTEHGLGMEYAGVITATGPGVTARAPGDRVFGLAPAALASHVVVPADIASPIPETMSFTEAATLPVVFATVHHSLAHLARLAPGETVLVHGGAGGIGLAVLQYARLHGARVIATAGSETKRDVLAALGAAHVLDSRTLDFAPRVRELTDGRGVDVVVNSLSGEAAALSLDLLRPGGRFIELGKRDMLENRAVHLRPFLRNLAYFGTDLNALLSEPGATDTLLSEVADHVNAGDYRPLPHSVHPAARVHEAFQLLQHSRHIGKVVVSFDPLDEPVPVHGDPGPVRLDGEGTYLVTGGLGGFGAATADWLAALGARHLALVSRRGPAAPEAAAVLDRLERRGVSATPYAADVTDESALRKVIAAVDATGHPLRGVVHSAMHLDDAPLADLTGERFAAVLAPKAAGAAVLHRLTADRDLDLFLLHSSLAARVGNHRQAAYAAGNGYLEALARARRSAGLAGTAVAWGGVAGTGYVARHHLDAALAALGIDLTPPDVLLRTAEGLLADRTAVAGIIRCDWARARRLFVTVDAPRFRPVTPAHTLEEDDTRQDFVRSLRTMDTDEAARAITEVLTRLLAGVLRTDPAELDVDRPLTECGIDSLMGAELLVRSHEYFDVRISPAELMSGAGTLTRIASLIQQRLRAGD
ncbi:SDR family NAD(P)-dependent oxidoreductase [Streptomyces sp. NPDC021100]|uniref:SDR family NAD(P)-dependent oxidoreductase n=1 Tax=Streptomyces sp. NPDC021100 TaxID=3365114 RepID=UPI00379138B0